MLHARLGGPYTSAVGTPQPVAWPICKGGPNLEDQLVKTTPTRWRWLALFLVMAMVAAACSSETTDTTADAGDSDTPETTQADTTDTTEATEPPAEGFTYSVAIFSDPTTDNPWAAIDTENDVWTGYVNPDMPQLYAYQGPTYTLIPLLAADEGQDGDAEEGKPEEKTPAPQSFGLPLGAYGLETVPDSRTVRIENATIWTSADDGILEDAVLIVDAGHVVYVGPADAALNAALLSTLCHGHLPRNQRTRAQIEHCGDEQ